MPEKLAKKLAKKPTGKLVGEPARSNLPDRREAISKMEPMLISESSKHRDQLNELVFELTAAATALRIEATVLRSAMMVFCSESIAS